MKAPAPRRVEHKETYWERQPPERSPRCAYWLERIASGWRPNRRISTLGYYDACDHYGVWLWEYLNEISPMIDSLRRRVTTSSAGT